MKKERNKINTLILFTTFILSQSLFWKLISLATGDNIEYAAFQFSFAIYFLLFSIFLTGDIDYFNSFWAKRNKLRRVCDKMIYYSGFICFWVIRIGLLVDKIFMHKDIRRELEVSKKEVAEEMRELEEMPLIVRMIFPVGVLTVIMLTIVYIVPECVVIWIQEILNSLVSVVGLLFVVVNAKERVFMEHDE